MLVGLLFISSFRFPKIIMKNSLILERVKGIEPSFQPWEGRVLPLYYTRGDLIAKNYPKFYLGAKSIEILWNSEQ